MFSELLRLTHTYTRTHTHTFTHAHTQTQKHAHTHTYIHTNTHTHIHTHTHHDSRISEHPISLEHTQVPTQCLMHHRSCDVTLATCYDVSSNYHMVYFILICRHNNFTPSKNVFIDHIYLQGQYNLI